MIRKGEIYCRGKIEGQESGSRTIWFIVIETEDMVF